MSSVYRQIRMKAIMHAGVENKPVAQSMRIDGTANGCIHRLFLF